MRNVVQISCTVGLILVLSCCRNLIPPPPVAPARTITGQDQAGIPKEKEQATIRALHKQVQERDRAILLRDQQIDMLSSQLDALKRIDKEEGTRAVRPPATLAP
jgi:hypothetical protein